MKHSKEISVAAISLATTLAMGSSAVASTHYNHEVKRKTPNTNTRLRNAAAALFRYSKEVPTIHSYTDKIYDIQYNVPTKDGGNDTVIEMGKTGVDRFVASKIDYIDIMEETSKYVIIFDLSVGRDQHSSTFSAYCSNDASVPRGIAEYNQYMVQNGNNLIAKNKAVADRVLGIYMTDLVHETARIGKAEEEARGSSHTSINPLPVIHSNICMPKI